LNVDGSKLAGQMGYLAEGLSAFSDRNLAVLGGLLGAGALFGAMKTPGGAAIRGVKIVTGMAMIGAGIGGFFAGLGVADAAANFMDVDGSKLASQMKYLSEGLGYLDTDQLIALGGLLGGGSALFAIAPGVSGQVAGLKAATGLTLIGLAIGGFFGGMAVGLGAGDAVLKFLGADGSGVSGLIEGLVDGLVALKPLEGMDLSAIGGGLSAIGVGLAAFFGGQLFGTITNDVKDGWNWVKENIFGLDVSESPLQKMVKSLEPLKDLDANALSNLAGVSTSLNQFADTLDRMSSIKVDDFGASMRNIASGVVAATAILPKMVNGGVAEVPIFNALGTKQRGVAKYDLGEGLLKLNSNIPLDELTAAMSKLREFVAPSPVTNIYQQAPQTGNVMNQMMSEFNQRQSQPNYVMIGGGNGNTSVQRGGDTVMVESPSPTDSRLRALGEATP